MPSAPAGSERFARSGATSGDAQIESLRLPPHSVEAEQAVLGGLLLSGSLALAQTSGTWSSTTGGNWSDTNNWSGGTVATGGSTSANVTPRTSAPR